ncbi:FRG domain-containing protein [uncultured Secundilactobacillus sp.]|uniref:FRG domain-containing protein n=1 Tax=uncultured Secundilactobacillus sp. TaxID=2813935 RepID=UPI00258B6201|nr:FRG domain-containing protein [uncultured Secundilactobacillus sp.]
MDYQKIFTEYDARKIFDTLTVDINLTATTFDDHKIYLLQEISVDRNDHTNELLKKLQQDVSKSVKSMDTATKVSDTHSSWSVFYALKELIDLIQSLSPAGYQAYFRGQAGSWELRPTMLRSGKHGYTDKFRENFEDIYKEISRKFPSEISYKTVDQLEERAFNLAELQHYGLGTPLIDVTENPFIGMIFMVDGYSGTQDFSEPQLDIFFVGSEKKNKLFQRVVRSKDNPRITAQKGAFLNFEKLSSDMDLGESVVPRISIRLRYVKPNIDEQVLSDLPEGELGGLDSDEDRDKEVTLNSAVMDIQEKLDSFFYRSEDLFPDFYMYLRTVKKRYSVSDEVRKNKWYEVDENK